MRWRWIRNRWTQFFNALLLIYSLPALAAEWHWWEGRVTRAWMLMSPEVARVVLTVCLTLLGVHVVGTVLEWYSRIRTPKSIELTLEPMEGGLGEHFPIEVTLSKPPLHKRILNAPKNHFCKIRNRIRKRRRKGQS